MLGRVSRSEGPLLRTAVPATRAKSIGAAIETAVGGGQNPELSTPLRQVMDDSPTQNGSARGRESSSKAGSGPHLAPTPPSASTTAAAGCRRSRASYTSPGVRPRGGLLAWRDPSPRAHDGDAHLRSERSPLLEPGTCRSGRAPTHWQRWRRSVLLEWSGPQWLLGRARL